ncbi:MAG: hypothetical protein AB4063_17195 [Crocosphaera sp.]
MSKILPYFDYNSLIGKYKARFGYVVQAYDSSLGDNYIRLHFQNGSLTDVHIDKIENFFSHKSEEKAPDFNLEACKNIFQITKAHYLVFAIFGVGITKQILQTQKITDFDNLISIFVEASMLFYLIYVNSSSRLLLKKYRGIRQQLVQGIHTSSLILLIIFILEIIIN